MAAERSYPKPFARKHQRIERDCARKCIGPIRPTYSCSKFSESPPSSLSDTHFLHAQRTNASYTNCPNHSSAPDLGDRSSIRFQSQSTIDALYSLRQCSSCGLRVSDYSLHLDKHFMESEAWARQDGGIKQGIRR
jgi:hypothetical protein